MADAEARIRPYNHNEDNKLFRFMLSKSRMEPLAIANKEIYKNRYGLALWILISSVLVQVLHWWPAVEFGWLGWLRPLPAYAICSLPLMFIIDWYNRPAFEEDAVKVLERPDVVNVQTYYQRSPSSGVWLFEIGQKFVGLVAVDASVDSLSEKTILEAQTQKTKSGKDITGTSSTAVIRHLYVVDTYRKAGAEKDLIDYAVDKTFTATNNVEKIRFSPSPLMKYMNKSLKEAGFDLVDKNGPKVGIFIWKWPTKTYELTREQWSSRRASRT